MEIEAGWDANRLLPNQPPPKFQTLNFVIYYIVIFADFGPTFEKKSLHKVPPPQQGLTAWELIGCNHGLRHQNRDAISAGDEFLGGRGGGGGAEGTAAEGQPTPCVPSVGGRRGRAAWEGTGEALGRPTLMHGLAAGRPITNICEDPPSQGSM